MKKEEINELKNQFPQIKKHRFTKRKSDKQSFKYYSILRSAEEVAEKVLKKVEEFNNIKGKAFERKTAEFKKNISEAKDINKALDEILIDAFALAHRAVTEIYGLNLFKVQIMGGYVLHKGNVAEMKTGEGKTLTAVLPLYLNALTGNGVHVVTVNDYLAQRDSFNTGKIFKLLGLTTGCVHQKLKREEKKQEYQKDITYTINSELGFDYLRDNLVLKLEQKVQRGFNYIIVDEVDSILIDEARTPLIISGGENYTDSEYQKADQFIKSLTNDDFVIDMETKQAFLSREGVVKAEKFFKLDNLYSYNNSRLVHLISNSLQANKIFKLDVDYIVKNDQIVLIDIFTGRLLEGRQFSEGLNQAIEAKENITIKPETKVFASITYQNLFRMYKKIAGMSGTAVPEEEEFLDVYNMFVVPIPTNEPVIRIDLVDVIFSSKRAKYDAIIKRIEEIHKLHQPILIGTRSVFESEIIASLLEEKGYKFEILNAKNHAREAEIISRAGEKNQITIATNMAGRGTDIKLGVGVKELGGLFVLGTEHNESRRIDFQLRGRSGRQGDIGISQFFVSLEDEIMQRAGLKKLQRFLKSMDSNPIESKMVQRSILMAQKKLEGLNYDYRKSIIEYDDVMNTQRIITYKQRDQFLNLDNINRLIDILIKSLATNITKDIDVYDNEMFNVEKYFQKIGKLFNFNFSETNIQQIEECIKFAEKTLKEKFAEKISEIVENKIKVDILFKNMALFSLDKNWQNQIDRLNKLKSGIRYHQYAQKNPVQVYVKEAEKLYVLYQRQIIEDILLSFYNFDSFKIIKTINLNQNQITKLNNNVKDLEVS